MSPQSPTPFSIHMFLLNGTPDGLKTVEVSNWEGMAIAGPNTRFDELRKRPEFEKTGVYVLTSQPEPDGLSRVYVGEGDPVADRLVSHHKQKEFWSVAVFFISKGDNLNKAHVQYLESRLISLANEAKRCILENLNLPQLPNLSEADTAYVRVFLEQMLLIFGVLGISVFQKPTGIAPSAQLLYIRAKGGLTAIGYEADAGFVVRAKSESPKQPGPSLTDPVLKLRQALLTQGVFVEEKDRWRMTQDYTFNSPSLAASVMLARAANGRVGWKDEKGKSLKEIQEARLI
jgi:hypothetical protein